MSAKCPKCERSLTNVLLVPVTASQGLGSAGWRAIAHACPSCATIFSVQLDTIAGGSDMEKHVEKTVAKATSALSEEIRQLAQVVRRLSR